MFLLEKMSIHKLLFWFLFCIFFKHKALLVQCYKHTDWYVGIFDLIIATLSCNKKYKKQAKISDKDW